MKLFFFWCMHALVIACCIVGFQASLEMHNKAEADRRGELLDKSVVQTPRARLFGGVDNAAIGLAYYPAIAVASFFFSVAPVRIAALVAAAAATAVSLYLLYSLLFITKMKCTNCWMANTMNVMILVMLGDLALLN
ncbi:MAG TPA: vitamin K epoxide reductase family protein [Candidatus Eremiobacteraceae bacterium]